MKKLQGYKITMNAPVILFFTCISLAAYILSVITRGFTNQLLFSVYRSSFLSPFTYIRFIGHVFGHAGWDHFFGNMTVILLIGPLLEEKYGKWFIIKVILLTALVTGIFHFIFFPGTMLLGASGVAFAFILLSSITGSGQAKTIPLTFLLIAVIYIGGQIFDGIFVRNNVSNITHIVGGAIGALAGFRLKEGLAHSRDFNHE